MVIALIAVIFGHSTIQVAPSDFTDGSAQIRQLKTGHIAVPVTINGHGPYWLGFDTGAPFSFISRRFARELNLISKNEASMSMMAGIGASYTVSNVKVGTAASKTLKVMVLDHPIVDLISAIEKTPLDGLVGMNFFGRYSTTLDYENQVLTFKHSGFVPKDIMGSVMKQVMRNPGESEVAKVNGVRGFEVRTSGKTIVIDSVIKQSPAYLAGLRQDDKLLSVDGRWITSKSDLYDALSGVPANEKIDFIVSRKGTTITVKIAATKGL